MRRMPPLDLIFDDTLATNLSPVLAVSPSLFVAREVEQLLGHRARSPAAASTTDQTYPECRHRSPLLRRAN